MVHDWVGGVPSDAWRPDIQARVHGDGICVDYVWIISAKTPRANLNATYWCEVFPDTADFRNLRNDIQQGLARTKMLASIRAEPRDLPPLANQHQEIHYLIKRHCLNPSQALALRQVLDESCIRILTAGAGTGKSMTLVHIKAVLWQQGYIVAENPDAADLSTINLGRRLGGREGDNPPPSLRSCVLVTTPTNAQVHNLLSQVHEESYVSLC